MIETKTPRCAICGKPVDPGHQPFCSARCKDVDLNRWLSGAYTIPGAEVPEDEEERPSPVDKKDVD